MFFGREDVFDFIRRNLCRPALKTTRSCSTDRGGPGKPPSSTSSSAASDTGYWCVFIDLHGLNLGGHRPISCVGSPQPSAANLRRDHQVTVTVPDTGRGNRG